ncbi:MAG: hypothetical protein L6Q38_19630, partial [Nitrospira sp.]|nr:hypothetical protein [Nitrospira sp.]
MKCAERGLTRVAVDSFDSFGSWCHEDSPETRTAEGFGPTVKGRHRKSSYGGRSGSKTDGIS